MDKLLSIIIPTYNMEEYLSKCLNSLLVTTLLDSLEIIIVNDGSKDNSLSIAYTFKNKYPESFIIIDKSNGNYGSCINSVLKIATGKYVKILDADDSFNTNNFNSLLNILGSIDVDLILSDYIQIDETGNEIQHFSYNIPTRRTLNFTDYCTDPILSNIIAMHAVTYKRKNLIDLGYIQSEGISYTDEEWIFMPMSTVNTVYYLNIPIYKYLIGRPGQTVNPQIALRNINHTIIGIKAMLKEYLSKDNYSEQTNSYLNHRLKKRIISIYRSYLLEKNELDISDLFAFDTYIKETCPSIYLQIGNTYIYKYIPFKFISHWRKKQYVNKLFISNIWDFFRNCKTIIRNTFNL